MTQQTGWIVTTSGEESLSGIRKQLEKAGFRVGNVLEAIGCITGTATEAVVEQSRTIKGVTDISADQSIDIGRPDSNITW